MIIVKDEIDTETVQLKKEDTNGFFLGEKKVKLGKRKSHKEFRKGSN